MNSRVGYLYVVVFCLCFFSCSVLSALPVMSRTQSRDLLTRASLNEATGKLEESLELTLAALALVRSDMSEESLEVYQKAIDLLWATGRDKEAISLCDTIIATLVNPQREQKRGLGLAVWKKSLIESGIQEGFSKKDKEQIAKVSNISVAKYVVPSEEKKSPNEMSGFFVMLASYTQEEIQNEHEIALEKEIQSWVDVKDVVKEYLNENKGTALEKAAESVIRHLESVYHGGKALGMELKNKFEDKDSTVSGRQDDDLCDIRDDVPTSYGDGLCDIRD